MQTEKSLAKVRGCTGLLELSLFAIEMSSGAIYLFIHIKVQLTHLRA